MFGWFKKRRKREVDNQGIGADDKIIYREYYNFSNKPTRLDYGLDADGKFAYVEVDNLVLDLVCEVKSYSKIHGAVLRILEINKAPHFFTFKVGDIINPMDYEMNERILING